MIHYTFNTNNSFSTNAKSFSVDVFEYFKPIAKQSLESGEYIPLSDELSAYTVKTTHDAAVGVCLFDLRHEPDKTPLASNALCTKIGGIGFSIDMFANMHKAFCDANPEFMHLYPIKGKPNITATVPFLLTYIQPGAILYMSVMEWMADFEQCYAKTLSKLIST